MTTKKDLDKMLGKLQKMQRDFFKQGSDKNLQLQARHADYGYVISISAYNNSKKKWFKPLEGEGYMSGLEMYSLTSYYSKEENEKALTDIMDFLDYGKC